VSSKQHQYNMIELANVYGYHCPEAHRQHSRNWR
jgi:hypothetical protein